MCIIDSIEAESVIVADGVSRVQRKTVVKHSCVILPVGGIGERYGYHSDTVALGCRHKAAPAALCISGLNAYSAAVRFKKPVVVYKQPWVVTAGDSGLVSGYYLGKRFVFKRSRSDQGKIRGGRIVLLVVKPCLLYTSRCV